VFEVPFAVCRAAVAPARVLPRQPEDELPHLGGDGRATAGLVTPDGPFAPDQLAVPLQDGVRLAEQDAVVQSRPRAGGQVRQLAGQDCQGELLPAVPGAVAGVGAAAGAPGAARGGSGDPCRGRRVACQ
jgi:hypothetical protein